MNTSIVPAKLLFINDVIVYREVGECIITSIDKDHPTVVVIEADGPDGASHTIAVRSDFKLTIKGH